MKKKNKTKLFFPRNILLPLPNDYIHYQFASDMYKKSLWHTEILPDVLRENKLSLLC